LKDIARKTGVRNAEKNTRELVRLKIIERYEELSEPRVKPRLVKYIRLNIDPADEIENLDNSGQKKQADILRFLSGYKEGLPLADLRKQFKNSTKTLLPLVEKETVSTFDKEVRRDPLSRYNIVPSVPPDLTDSQARCWLNIEKSISGDSSGNHDVFLLQGVTGSGKTEIYLHALERTVAQGKKGICLVPEIALTPQTIERFASRFPGRIAVFHSGLSQGEQYDEWRRIADGCCDVVIGPRSALFTPQPDLGLIIVDEEHEWTYKQTEKTPRYHARTAAVKLGEYCGAVTILGSATPDVESYYRAERGDFRLITLPERITVRGITPLPDVEVIDMRQELKEGNRGILSRLLVSSLRNALEKREQSILFLNRRGTANFARCVNCGYTVRCPRCMVALTYHAIEKKLVCHHCNYRVKLSEVCPDCRKPRIKLFGTGTQKVEEEIKTLFPEARIDRWDSDAAGARGASEQILNRLTRHETDILIGTQVIAKGLDLPKVTVAGVINADTGLNYPDFRSGERTFQLTCQIAGRAGRGMGAGKVIVQTYNPEYYAIKAAAKHDYLSFYHKEIEYRRSLGYPPFNQLANMVFSHSSTAVCSDETQKMLKVLVAEKDRKGVQELRFMGPVPAVVPKVRGKYRWQILLCGSDLSDFLREIEIPRGWLIDIDPAGVF